MKHVASKIIALLISIWHDGKKVIHDYAEKSIEVLAGIKAVVENPVVATIVDLTPFPWDDLLRDYAMKWLPKIIVDLQFAKDLSQMQPTEQLNALIDFFRNSSPDMRDAIYIKIATLLTKFHVEDDGVGRKFSQSDLDMIVQVGYCGWK